MSLCKTLICRDDFISIFSSASVENADNTEAGSPIRDTLAVCDSLNKLHETFDGFITASYVSDRIGKNLSNVEPLNNNVRIIVFSIMNEPIDQGNNGGLTTPKKYQAW